MNPFSFYEYINISDIFDSKLENIDIIKYTTKSINFGEQKVSIAEIGSGHPYFT